ncbi:alpha-actinin-4-like [Ptychodera flava]|uniref:alpha-actinin-4-like n=1 Tax=Ptychodera flava TaxID=63121 RepID=UPI00396A167F
MTWKTECELDDDDVKMSDSGKREKRNVNDIGYLWNMNKQCYHIEYSELRPCLESLGYPVREGIKGDREFQKILEKLDPYGKGRITYEMLENFLSREPSSDDPDVQINESFMLLARGKKYITPDQLRNTFPPDIAEYCIARMSLYEGPAIEGALDYSTFDMTIKHPDYR